MCRAWYHFIPILPACSNRQPPQVGAALRLHLTCLAGPELGAPEGAPAASGAPPAAEASLCCRDAGRPPVADLTALPPAFGSLILGGPGGALPCPPSFTLKRGLVGSTGALPGRPRPGWAAAGSPLTADPGRRGCSTGADRPEGSGRPAKDRRCKMHGELGTHYCCFYSYVWRIQLPQIWLGDNWPGPTGKPVRRGGPPGLL